MKAYRPPFLIYSIMVTIEFFTYTGHADTVNKQLSGGVSVSGLLRDSFDILNPIITVRSKTNITANYCYIPVFGRYYFIEGVRVESNDKYEIRLSVDVLKTYETEILNATGTATERDGANKYSSNRNGVYDVRPHFEKVAFPNTGLLSEEGSIIMVTLKGEI